MTGQAAVIEEYHQQGSAQAQLFLTNYFHQQPLIPELQTLCIKLSFFMTIIIIIHALLYIKKVPNMLNLDCVIMLYFLSLPPPLAVSRINIIFFIVSSFMLIDLKKIFAK